MKKDLPIYTIHISDADNMIVDMVSIVNAPAHESNFLSFSKQKENVNKYQFSSDDKRQLMGAAIIPDLPIYRKDEDGSEYYVVFTRQEIEEIEKVFMSRGLLNNLNVEHTKKDADSLIYGSFVTSEYLPAPPALDDLPVGTWIVNVQVNDEALWEDIKSGKRNGFSVEGLFNLVEINKEMKTEIVIEDVEEEEDDEEDVSVLLKKIQAYSAYLTRKK